MARRSYEELASEYRQKSKELEEKAKRLEFSLREKERKAKLKAFCEIGALAELAGLSWKRVDRVAVLGAFAKLAEAQADPSELGEYVQMGKRIKERRAASL